MAKQSMIHRNLQRKNHVLQAKERRDGLKKKIYDKSLSQEERFQYVLALAKMSPDSSATRVRNRCLLSGRSRGVYRKFGLCRICFREKASQGKLPGIRKSSW